MDLGRGARLALVGVLSYLLAGCGGGDSGNVVVEDVPIAYVKRPVPVGNNGQVQDSFAQRVLGFQAGGDLWLRERASVGAAERNVTSRITLGQGDVKDVEVSYDGRKLLFALHLPLIENVTEADQTDWDIWEYDIPSDQLRRVMTSNIVAHEAQDIAPHYLPDGRIIFSSTRQKQSGAVLLDESKLAFQGLDEDRRERAAVLHVMNSLDGGDIRQVSFNQSHDLDATVLSSGEVLFSRWDHMGGRNEINLYRMRPDGTETELYYGAHSHLTGTGTTAVQFTQPRQLSDGRLLAIIRAFNGTQGGGDIAYINAAQFIDYNQSVQASAGSGQASATGGSARTDSAVSDGGRFGSAYPLGDNANRLLVTWSQCRLDNNGRYVPCTPEALAVPQPTAAPPLYGIYVYDTARQTMLPIVAPQEGTLLSEVVAVQARKLPWALSDKQAVPNAPLGELNADYANEGVGVLHIRSVYDMDGIDTAPGGLGVARNPGLTTADQRPARFLRLVKAVASRQRLNNNQNFPASAFGVSQGQKMREIIGYAPIEPDGSVMIKVPANIAFAIEVLDKNGRRIGQRHQSWLQLKAGETRECNGCHTHTSGKPHGRRDGPVAVNQGAPAGGMPFSNTIPTWLANAGETMAQTRARISCVEDSCAALLPNVDVKFDDVWTDSGVRAPDTSFAYRYADLMTTAPAPAACQTAWNSKCRVVINYEQHIHPLWNLARTDGMGADRTCTLCHSDADNMGAKRVPLGQLDLGDGPSDQQNGVHFKSYRELLFTDNELELVGGALQDRQVQTGFQTDQDGNRVLDNNGQPIPVFAPVTVPPALSATGATASTRFMSRFNAGGSHAGRLTAAELRLVSEWLDIGAQYFNNPFDTAIPGNN